MRGTDTQIQLLLRQLRKARDEVARARVMLIAVGAGDDEAALGKMVTELAGIIDSILRADDADEGP